MRPFSTCCEVRCHQFSSSIFVQKEKNFEQTFDKKMLCCFECFSWVEIGQKPNEFAKIHTGIGFRGASILRFWAISLSSKGFKRAKIHSNTGKDLSLATPVNSGFERVENRRKSPEKYFKNISQNCPFSPPKTKKLQKTCSVSTIAIFRSATLSTVAYSRLII